MLWFLVVHIKARSGWFWGKLCLLYLPAADCGRLRRQTLRSRSRPASVRFHRGFVLLALPHPRRAGIFAGSLVFVVDHNRHVWLIAKLTLVV